MSKIIAVNALGALLLLMAGVWSPAAANGALAVGTTSNVVKDGVAFGTAINYQTEAEARTAALAY
jgi:predicted peptidase